MEKLRMESLDKVSENVRKIAALFPNCVTERRTFVRGGQYSEKSKTELVIDFDKLKQELSDYIVEGAEERYQFTWPDKKKAILTANSKINKTLRPCREESVNFDTTENLYIEGDNLEVLKLLQETYLGKVKMIYIDPPYNTGSDFVYRDNFTMDKDEYMENSGQSDEDGNRMVQNLESNGRYHTDWLNMMYPRLKLARDLLADDGVIFISIDDNEVENLKKICDEVFGEWNCAATFVWNKTSTPPALSYKCRKTVEYILAYEKILNKDKYFGAYIDGGDAPLLNAGNMVKELIFPVGSIKFTFKKNGIELLGVKEKLEVMNDIHIKNMFNMNEVKLKGEFKWDQTTLNEEIKKGTYFIVKTDKYSIRFQREKDDNLFKTPTNYIEVEKIFNKENGVGTNEQAVKDMGSLNLKECFDYTKPYSLVRKIIEMKCKFSTESIILDFFSGSATTAHAVMQLNAEDSGHRKFIMVQLPELTDEKSEAYKAGYKNICEIGKERIRRAGAKIKSEHPEAKDLDIGFRVLKCDSSNMKDVYYTPADTINMNMFDLVDNVKEDRTAEDLLFQCMLEFDAPLSSAIETMTIGDKTVYNVAGGHLMACFDTDVTEEVITEVAKLEPSYFVMRDSSLANDSVAANFEQIFKTYSPSTERRVL